MRLDQDDRAVVTRLLANLSSAHPDANRSARVASRCKSVLELKAAAHEARSRRSVRRRQLIELSLVGGFCLVYVSAVLLLALRFEGIL